MVQGGDTIKVREFYKAMDDLKEQFGRSLDERLKPINDTLVDVQKKQASNDGRSTLISWLLPMVISSVIGLLVVFIKR